MPEWKAVLGNLPTRDDERALQIASRYEPGEDTFTVVRKGTPEPQDQDLVQMWSNLCSSTDKENKPLVHWTSHDQETKESA